LQHEARLFVLVLMLLSRGWFADGAAVPPVSGCSTPPPDSDGIPSWYGVATDRSKGLVCRFSVNSALPDHVFHLESDPRGRYLARIAITTTAGAEVQTIPVLKHWLDAPSTVPYLRADDIDFDGYADLGLMVDFKPLDNACYKYWFFDRATGRFVEEQETPDLCNPRTDPAAREVQSLVDEGGAGTLYTRSSYRVAHRGLRLIRRESQEWREGHYQRVVREARDGTLVVVSTKVVPEAHPGPYDPAQWALVKRVSGRFGSDVGRADALLLCSKEVTGETGIGDGAHDVNLVMARGQEVLYRFKSAPPRFAEDTEMRYCTGSHLQVRDVTGDGVPEVEFEAGFQAASSDAANHHVIHYNARRRAFEDVSHPDFVSGSLTKFEWIDLEGTPVAVRATAICADDESHYSPHFYAYTAYCWNAVQGRFVRMSYSEKSRDRYDDGGPLKAELELIVPAIREATRAVCQPDLRSVH
jgi:hypothetical protein